MGRRGNATLREVLIECALAGARTHHCQFGGYRKALTVRRGYKRATAHKLLRVIHCMHQSMPPYLDPETNYEALMVERRSSRWIRILKRYRLDPATAEIELPTAA